MSCDLKNADKKEFLEYALFTIIERCQYFEQEYERLCKNNKELGERVHELSKENGELSEDVVKLKNRILQLGGSDSV